MIPKKINILLLMLVAALLSACGRHTDAPQKGAEQTVADTTSLVLQVAKCSKLYTTEYQVHKIVTHDDVMRVQGTFLARKFSMNMPIGDRKVAIPMDATLKAYIDFSTFSEGNIEREGDRIHITLPDPRVVVTSSKIDHHATKQFIDLTRTAYSDAEMADFARQGLASIVQTVPQMGILEQARFSATRTLVPIITRMGYREEDIIISFRKDFTADDLPQLLDNKTLKIDLKP